MGFWEPVAGYFLGVTPMGRGTWYTSTRTISRTEAQAWMRDAWYRQGGRSRITLWQATPVPGSGGRMAWNTVDFKQAATA